MRVVGPSSEDEMIACFLNAELSSKRFGATVRSAVIAAGQPETLVTHPNLDDPVANTARRALLATTRGYGEGRELFKHFPARVRWVWALLAPHELARTRYMDYSYWIELSGGSRLPRDAAQRIRNGVRAYGVPNARFLSAAKAISRGERLPPPIFVGRRRDDLVCLEGHLRLTAHALAGFPSDVMCLVGTARTMGLWAL